MSEGKGLGDGTRSVPATLRATLFDPEGEVRITRGTNLPHWFQKGATYFITFRTEDSLPREVARRWYSERERWLAKRGVSEVARVADLPAAERREYYERFSRAWMENLDKGWGECVLRRPELSRVVAECLLHFDGERYEMGDFVVMPNHVHLVVGLTGETDVVKQCRSWKRFSAREINKRLGRDGRFWQEDSFDRLVRSVEQLEAMRRYIGENPVGLREGEYFLYRR